MTTGFGAATVDYTYDGRQRLLTENAVAYAWDDNGNQLGKSGGDVYEWDFDDRLVKVTKPDGTVVENTYDVDGVLVRTRVVPAGGSTMYQSELVVDTAGALSHVVGEAEGAALGVVYVRGGNMLLGEIRRGEASYHEAEAIGSVRALLNDAGAVSETYRFTAFGEDLASPVESVNSYKFAGERQIEAAGLYQNRARWLMPSTGAFLSQDHGPPTGYSYAHGDGINFSDPSGYMEYSVANLVTTMALGATVGAFSTYYSNIARGHVQTWQSIAYGAAIGAFAGPIATYSVVGAAALAGMGAFTVKDLPTIILDSSLPKAQRLSALGLLAGALWGTTQAAATVSNARLNYANLERIVSYDIEVLNTRSTTGIGEGRLTPEEWGNLQKVADRFGTVIEVVGSRARGEGRNVDIGLPPGKGAATTSDIDVLIDSQVDIDTGGLLSDAILNSGPGGLFQVRSQRPGGTTGAVIRIEPRRGR